MMRYETCFREVIFWNSPLEETSETFKLSVEWQPDVLVDPILWIVFQKHRGTHRCHTCVFICLYSLPAFLY